ncbi:LysR family transcriptional regulator [Intestinibacter sp.]
MNLQQLEYFVTIGRTRNFTTAANILLISQPALSKAMSKLKEELEVPLFEKSGRNIKITRFGEVFLSYAQLALNNIEKGIDELKYMKNDTENHISLAYTECIGSSFIPFIISSFLNNHSDIKFQFNTSSTTETLENLKARKVDLGFIDSLHEIEKYSELESVLVSKQKYVLVTPKNHPLSSKTEVSLKDLKDESFVVFKNGCSDKNISYQEFIDYKPKIAVQPSEASMLVSLVAAGVGITIVPNTPMINTNKISVLDIKEDIGHKNTYMAWNKNTYKSKIVNEFKEHIINSYSEE